MNHSGPPLKGGTRLLTLPSVFYAELASVGKEGSPMKDNKSAITALVFSVLMIISPMAGAANVSTFSGGESDVTVEVRDGPDYTNIVDGTVNLPSGDTVTSASVKISTDMATHETYTTINSDSANTYGIHSTTTNKPNSQLKAISLTPKIQ